MAPVLKVGHVGVSSAIEAVEPVDLAVVEEITNDVGDLGGGRAGGNVLPVAAAASSRVVGVLAGLCDFERDGDEGCVPCCGGGGVVGAVDVVVG